MSDQLPHSAVHVLEVPGRAARESAASTRPQCAPDCEPASPPEAQSSKRAMGHGPREGEAGSAPVYTFGDRAAVPGPRC